MVVWVFSGGGEAEIRGIIPFLHKHFPDSTFERKTPIRKKPGPRPKAEAYKATGKTGKSLLDQIKIQLHRALQQGTCDVIFILDDLDCHDAETRKRSFLETTTKILGEENIPICVGLAAPELESWIIADWDNTFAKDIDFRKKHEGMRWELSHQKYVPFERPETFSHYDPGKDACKEKLSEVIIEVAKIQGETTYSKATHTPRLLLQSNPEIVKSKCPLFNTFYSFLSECC